MVPTRSRSHARRSVVGSRLSIMLCVVLLLPAVPVSSADPVLDSSSSGGSSAPTTETNPAPLDAPSPADASGGPDASAEASAIESDRFATDPSNCFDCTAYSSLLDPDYHPFGKPLHWLSRGDEMVYFHGVPGGYRLSRIEDVNSSTPAASRGALTDIGGKYDHPLAALVGADVDADGVDEVVALDLQQRRLLILNGTTGNGYYTEVSCSNEQGWDRTPPILASGDIDGDGAEEIALGCARENGGSGFDLFDVRTQGDQKHIVRTGGDVRFPRERDPQSLWSRSVLTSVTLARPAPGEHAYVYAAWSTATERDGSVLSLKYAVVNVHANVTADFVHQLNLPSTFSRLVAETRGDEHRTVRKNWDGDVARAYLAAGNVDSDPGTEIVMLVESTLATADYSPDDGWTLDGPYQATTYLLVFDDAFAGERAWKPLAASKGMDCTSGLLPNGWGRARPDLSVGDIDGDARDEILCSASTGGWADAVYLYEDATMGFERVASYKPGWGVRVASAMLVDLRHTGRADVILGREQFNVFTGARLSTTIGLLERNGETLHDGRVFSASAGGQAGPILLAPAALDRDGVVVKWPGPQAHVTTMTKPTVIAIVAPPPQVKGIGQEEGQVYVEFAEEQCNALESNVVWGMSFRAGGGAKVFSGMGGFDLDMAKSSTKGVCYETGDIKITAGSEPIVISRQAPIDIYDYQIVASPDPSLIEKNLRYVVPGREMTYQMPLSVFNRALAQYEDATGSKLADPIDLTIFRSGDGQRISPGAPLSYPSESERDEILESARTAFDVAEPLKDSLDDFVLDLFGRPIILDKATPLIYSSKKQAVGIGSGSSSVVLARTNSEEDTYSWTLAGAVDLEFGADIGPKVAVGVYAGGGEGYTVSKSSSVSITAITGDIPDPALWRAYNYEWGMFTFPHKYTSSNTAMVVDFWVTPSTMTPPPMPVTAPPLLVAPTAGSTVYDRTPVFTWQPVPNAFMYEVDVRRLDADTKSYSKSVLVTRADDGSLPENLVWPDRLPDGTYEWTVTAFDRAGALAAPDQRTDFSHTRSHPARFAVLPAPEGAYRDIKIELEAPKDKTWIVFNLSWTRPTDYVEGELGRVRIAAHHPDDPGHEPFAATALQGSQTWWYWYFFNTYSNGTVWIQRSTDAGEGPWMRGPSFEIPLIRDKVVPKATIALDGTPTWPILWEPVANATEYIVNLDAPPGGRDRRVTVNTTSFTPVDPEIRYQDYKVRVRGVNAFSLGPLRSAGLAVSAPVPPSSPALLAAVERANEHAPPVTWGEVANASWYSVEVSQSRTFRTVEESLTIFAGGPLGFNASDLADGSYFLRVRAENAGGPAPWSAPFDFVVTKPPAGTPAPQVFEATQDARLFVTWAPLQYASVYDISVRNTSDSSIALDMRTRGTLWIPYGHVEPGSYAVRVRALSPAGVGAWSAELPLRIPQPITEAPRLFTAKHDAEDERWLPAFPVAWNPVTGASRYDLELSSAPTFETAVRKHTAVETQWNPFGLPDGTYWVRARARDALGPGPWSDATLAHVGSVDNLAPEIRDVPLSLVAVNETDAPPLVVKAARSSAGDPALPLSWNRGMGGPWLVETSDNATFGDSDDVVRVANRTHYAGNGLAAGRHFIRIGEARSAEHVIWSEPVSVMVPKGYRPVVDSPLLEGPAAPSGRITWEAVPRADDYWVIVREAASGLEVMTSSAKSPAWTPSDLAPGEYTVQVAGRNPSGLGPASDVVSVQVAGTALAPPDAHAAAADGFTAIAWTPIPGAKHYEISYSSVNDSRASEGTARAPGASWMPAPGELAPGVWSVQVRAAVAEGPGPWSNRVNVTIPPPPNASPALTIVNALAPGTPRLEWAPVQEAARYELAVAPSPKFTASATIHALNGTSWTPQDVADGVYFVRVRAVNQGGEGPWSDATNFTTAAIGTTGGSAGGAATPPIGLAMLLAGIAIVSFMLRRRP